MPNWKELAIYGGAIVVVGSIAKNFGAGQGIGELGTGFSQIVRSPFSGVGQGLGDIGTGLAGFAKGLGDLLGANRNLQPPAPGVGPGGGYGGGGGGMMALQARPAIMRQDYTAMTVAQTYSRPPQRTRGSYY